MAFQLQGNPSQHGYAGDLTGMFMTGQPQRSSRGWYLSRVEIEEHSPSRKDGIDLNMEAHLRKLYCSFLKDLGRTLKVPQMTIATAMMFCHRFYLRQSHAKNDWQSIATVSMFTACKVEETPCLLKNVVVVAYELTYRWDPSAPRRIKQKEIYEKQKDLITVGERLLLATLAFDFNIEHPYKPLVSALKKLDISHKDIAKVAWNFVNDWLCTTLCLQYKPHYIAATSLFLAAKFNKVKLPMENGKLWWHEFDISPKQLEEVIQHMLRLLEQTRKQTQPSKKGATESTTEVGKVDPHVTQPAKATSSVAAHSSISEVAMESESGLSNCTATTSARRDNKTPEAIIISQESDAGSTRSAVEDGDVGIPLKVPDPDSFRTTGPKVPDSDSFRTTGVPADGKHNKLDVNSIREKLKKRKLEKAASVKLAHTVNDESDLWIEKELENGIDLGYTSTEKKQRTSL